MMGRDNMPNICSTCRFNGGTIEEIYKFIFETPLANGVLKDLIYCTCKDKYPESSIKFTNDKVAVVNAAIKLSDCPYWEACNG
jgi:hypothetical protein